MTSFAHRIGARNRAQCRGTSVSEATERQPLLRPRSYDGGDHDSRTVASASARDRARSARSSALRLSTPETSAVRARNC